MAAGDGRGIAARIPLAPGAVFAAGLRAQVEAVEWRALDAATARKYAGHVQAFVALCRASGMKIGFNYRQMSQWCVFYCREG